MHFPYKQFGDSMMRHKEKRKLIYLKLGIDQFNKIYSGFGKIWGWGDKISVISRHQTPPTFNK